MLTIAGAVQNTYGGRRCSLTREKYVEGLSDLDCIKLSSSDCPDGDCLVRWDVKMGLWVAWAATPDGPGPECGASRPRASFLPPLSPCSFLLAITHFYFFLVSSPPSCRKQNPWRIWMTYCLTKQKSAAPGNSHRKDYFFSFSLLETEKSRWRRTMGDP